MATLVWLLLVFPAISAEPHTLRYFYTASSGVPNFAEFVAVGYVDDVQIIHYDSDMKKAEPRQAWMKRVKEEDPEYWERQAVVSLRVHHAFKANIEILKGRFNRTGDVHIFQNMYGCEWDDETGEIDGYDQYGFDGEDFIALDMRHETWVAAVQQAVITKQYKDQDRFLIAQEKHYFNQICIKWLKKYLSYGKSSLQRTVLPMVSLLQKSPYSPVTCHATGFYPGRAVMFWRKDGEELLEEGVDQGEILPNHDGTYQITADLKVPPEQDWDMYECVFQLSGVETDIVTRLEKSRIRNNEVTLRIVAIIVFVFVVIVLVATGIMFCTTRAANRRQNLYWSPPPAYYPDVREELNPTDYDPGVW